MGYPGRRERTGMVSRSIGWSRIAGAAGVLVLVGLTAGCGWTARDEFLVERGEHVAARPGDGSRIASPWKDSRGRPGAAAEVAARFDDDR